MKQKKTHYADYRYDDEDEYLDTHHKGVKKPNSANNASQKRRPIKNWTKVWSEHADEADEYDEFYAKK